MLPAHIVRRIEYIVEGKGGFPIDEEARQHGAIALMGTIGTIWMLRPDGTFWDADADWGKPLQPLEDRLHLMALAVGTERYPWLAELLPPRPADAIDCGSCGGSGSVGVGAPPGGGFLCQACDALGWRRNPASEG